MEREYKQIVGILRTRQVTWLINSTGIGRIGIHRLRNYLKEDFTTTRWRWKPEMSAGNVYTRIYANLCTKFNDTLFIRIQKWPLSRSAWKNNDASRFAMCRTKISIFVKEIKHRGKDSSIDHSDILSEFFEKLYSYWYSKLSQTYTSDAYNFQIIFYYQPIFY